MSLRNFAESELDRVLGKDEMDQDMRKCVLDIIDIFSEQGHSGFSAALCTNLVTKLMKFEPLTPITGEDDEWMEVGPNMFQNKRCSHVFKDADGKAYDSEGIIFYDILKNEDDGSEFKSYYTSSNSRVFIEFPYTPTKIYVERPEES